MKCFIINHNLKTWPGDMIKEMESLPVDPIIIDNASTDPEVLDWYETKPCKVIKFSQNMGHKVLWTSGILQSEVKDDYFILTDPDLDLSVVRKDNLIDKLKEGLNRYGRTKAGLALRLDDMPDEFIMKNQVLIWETPFWANHLGDDFYDAPIDTTFALYRPGSVFHTLDAVRVGGEYTTRHLPFYLTENNMPLEVAKYFNGCNKEISTMARFLDPIVQKVLNA